MEEKPIYVENQYLGARSRLAERAAGARESESQLFLVVGIAILFV